MDAMDEVERGMIEQIAEVKRELTGDIRDQVVAEMERGLAEIRARRPASNSRLSGAIAAELKYITDYEAAHSEQEMQQPAFLPEGLKRGFRGAFWDESQGGHMLVRVDPGYFRRDLSPEAAQLVTLLWTSENESEASDRWRLSLERNFPLDRLRSMIDR